MFKIGTSVVDGAVCKKDGVVIDCAEYNAADTTCEDAEGNDISSNCLAEESTNELTEATKIIY